MVKLVTFRVLDGIAVITLNAPPTNAVSAPVRTALWDAFVRVAADDAIKGVALVCAGSFMTPRTDMDGNDIPSERPALGVLCDQIEGCEKPVVMAVQGETPGAVCEILLAAHYRLAGADARVGLPAVTQGLVPSGGGTQRLPRLIGAARSLQMIVSGNSMDAAAAQRAGLIDGIVLGDLTSGAVVFAQNLLQTGRGPRRTRDNRSVFKEARTYLAAISKARTALADTPLFAPKRAIECVEAAMLLPFDAGIALEADAFARCLAHPQSRALRHIFLAERHIDDALMVPEGGTFYPVAPMGKAVVFRLRTVLQTAAAHMVATGMSQATVDGALVAFGFHKGLFGGRNAGASPPEVMRKLLAALVVEGLMCVDQQAVQRPCDIDALAVHGLGFPRRHGGPMRAAHTMGLIKLRADLRDWGQENPVWAVPELLDEAIKDARGFDALGLPLGQ